MKICSVSVILTRLKLTALVTQFIIISVFLDPNKLSHKDNFCPRCFVFLINRHTGFTCGDFGFSLNLSLFLYIIGCDAIVLLVHPRGDQICLYVTHELKLL